MVQEEFRKGPWTEQEDVQLVFYVNLFGDRRWDFLAKVSGLKRTGKSCRLRWVNYLHPGLKRCKMTPQVDEANERNFYDTGGDVEQLPPAHDNGGAGAAKAYTMDEIWKDIEQLGDVYCGNNQPRSVTTSSPMWNYWAETLWMTTADYNPGAGGGESKIVSSFPLPPPPTNDQFYSSFDNQGSIFLTG
nr:transcription factor MYB48-like [Ipomoea batatas]